MTQQDAYNYYFPVIRDNGQEYLKCCLVYAYPAALNEYIETWTIDGLETTNYAKLGDFVVQNLNTQAQEKYIVPKDVFFKRYSFFYFYSDGAIYKSEGKVLACKYLGEDTKFVAKWGRLMSLKCGDHICAPSPYYDEVYRIAAQEFYETYEKICPLE